MLIYKYTTVCFFKFIPPPAIIIGLPFLIVSHGITHSSAIPSRSFPTSTHFAGSLGEELIMKGVSRQKVSRFSFLVLKKKNDVSFFQFSPCPIDPPPQTRKIPFLDPAWNLLEMYPLSLCVSHSHTWKPSLVSPSPSPTRSFRQSRDFPLRHSRPVEAALHHISSFLSLSITLAPRGRDCCFLGFLFPVSCATHPHPTQIAMTEQRERVRKEKKRKRRHTQRPRRKQKNVKNVGKEEKHICRFPLPERNKTLELAEVRRLCCSSGGKTPGSRMEEWRI